MIQLIQHLFGDFCFQADWMAEHKGKFTLQGWIACLVHCLIYAGCFIIITQDPVKLLLIFATHFIIDKFRLAYYWCELFEVGKRFDFSNWLKIYLIFMVDMAFHLSCNYFILLYA